MPTRPTKTTKIDVFVSDAKKISRLAKAWNQTIPQYIRWAIRYEQGRKCPRPYLYDEVK